MARSRLYKYPFNLFQYNHSTNIFVCKLCGMEVERRNRTMHLKYFHPEIYQKYKNKK
jgi:hypothetical protein